MPFLEHANLQFYFRQSGRGVPFFFQHGLGAEVSQPFGLFRPPPGARLIAMDCRGHGRSSLGPANSLRFRTFADDLRALMNYLGISRAIVGGISMGAGVALNFALRYPGNVLGLVLSRPAWLDKPNAFNVRMFSLIACLIKEHGPAAGLKRFRASSELAEIRSKYPDTAKSLESQFLRKRARETCPILEQIPNDRPNPRRAQWNTISVPTLILANRRDPVHPYEYAKILAAHIPRAELRQIVSKSANVALHEWQVQAFIEHFLTKHFV